MNKGNLLYWAWYLITNADWSTQSVEWQRMAARWRAGFLKQLPPLEPGVKPDE